MKMCVATIAFLISALIYGSLGAKQKECPDCYEKCTAHHDFVCKDCSTFEYRQYDPCSYQCVCEGTYMYYTETDGTKCGNDYECRQGSCQLKIKGVDCSRYGECYAPVWNSYQPCTYQCVNTKGCGQYSENVKDGTACYQENCCSAGVCKGGRCLTKGGCDSCNQGYYYGRIDKK